MSGTEAGTWRMFAHRYDSGDLHNLGSRRYVEFHGVSAPIVEVDVVEVSDDDPTATHWGWMGMDITEPVMIYPREVLFRVCFPYGVQAEVDAGKGRVVRLAVTEVGDA
ncbi:hypothetical protein Caci_2982 [Catenulispora acidiphila DSM 44928]|uniref:Uncharacterized protein n=1 Tax=Catenulispora acidiphila (strain DSM 44928 / JCM 14897 / NBRC 102108 / NRRL B-24433 / ID139908) TaxID=479433 RepID=C7Q2Z9_CATAD|nr:hypothetical protein [Catenulispora acidiphila]ACU71891.1 hypothetical protein Caci_2982 [Catenulispora acidiphila DSM 44928]